MESSFKYLFAVLGFVFLIGIAGCGGGGTASPTKVSPSISVDWPARTRDVSGLSSALSVSFVLHDPTGKQTDVSFFENRATNLAAHTETYTFPTAVLPGNFQLSGTFYSAASGGGITVGTFGAAVTVQSNGGLADQSGSPLGTIQTTGVVKSVTVEPGQTVVVGSSSQLLAYASDANGSILALSAGSFTFAVASGGSLMSLTTDGIATGFANGFPMVTATVDGVTSPPVAVAVNGPTNATITVDWPQRSRDISGPSSALSVTIQFKGYGSQTQSVKFSVDRDSNLAAHSVAYPVPTQLVPGSYILSGTFYAQAGEQGTVVATCNVAVAVTNLGAITQPDGSPLGTVNFTGSVASVVVASNQLVPMTQTQQLTVIAQGQDGEILALTPGSFIWNVTAGGSNMTLTADGIATGVATGTATVTATVDGITSQPTTLTVAPYFVQVAIHARSIAYDPVHQVLLVSPWNENTLDVVNAATGAIQPVSLPAAPICSSMSGDNSSVIVGCTDNQVRFLDSTTYAITQTIPTPDNTNPTNVFGLPNTSTSFVLSDDPNSYVMDGATPRANYASLGPIEAMNSAGTALVGLSYPNGVYTVATISSTGVTGAVSGSSSASPGVAYQDGFPIGEDGTIISPTTGNIIGTLPVIPSSNRIVGSTGGSTDVAFITWEPKVCQIMNVATQTEVGHFNIPETDGGDLEPVYAGPHRLAYYTFGFISDYQVVIVNDSYIP